MTPPTPSANGYGWLGTIRRTTTNTDLLLMGARPYNPTTGHFTTLDPINKQDLSGRAWWETIKTRLGVASLFGCGACGAVAFAMSAVDVGRALYRRRHRQALLAALDFVPFDIGRAGRVVARIGSSAAKQSARKTLRNMSKAERKNAKSPSRMAAKCRAQTRRKARKVARRVEIEITAYGAGMWACPYLQSSRRRR